MSTPEVLPTPAPAPTPASGDKTKAYVLTAVALVALVVLHSIYVKRKEKANVPKSQAVAE